MLDNYSNLLPSNALPSQQLGSGPTNRYASNAPSGKTRSALLLKSSKKHSGVARHIGENMPPSASVDLYKCAALQDLISRPGLVLISLLPSALLRPADATAPTLQSNTPLPKVLSLGHHLPHRLFYQAETLEASPIHSLQSSSSITSVWHLASWLIASCAVLMGKGSYRDQHSA